MLTEATPGLLLIHVPPEAGNKLPEEPIHKSEGPFINTDGLAFTITGSDGSELHPKLFVKTNLAEPFDKPVTKPPLETIAILGFKVAHVPPLVGFNVVLDPTHIELAPDMLMTGLAFTVTALVLFETQPVDDSVYLKVAFPCPRPVTTPELDTVATEGLLLTQVPSNDGERVEELPTQMLLEPVTETFGIAFIVTEGVGFEIQPVCALVKVNVAVPAETEVTSP